MKLEQSKKQKNLKCVNRSGNKRVKFWILEKSEKIKAFEVKRSKFLRFRI